MKPKVPYRTIAKTIAGIAIASIVFLLLSIAALRWVNPPFTAFTLSEDWNALNMQRHSLTTYWVEADEIPQQMRWAVIASEDQRFYQHKGLDLDAIEQAMEEYKRGDDLRGASTITQQVAKNLFLWPAKTYFRKGLEAGIAVVIDAFWPKERILEVYVNIAEYGPGIYGIGKAADEFYNKKPHDLTAIQSARLATVLPNPKRMRAAPPSPFVQKRSKWVLRQMRQLTGVNYAPQPKQKADEEIEDHKALIREWNTLSVNNFKTDSLIQYTSGDSVLNINRIDTLQNR
ncbi:MAG: monofunctional biosynthetic peptidoglycan transglycosylase [Balneolaceae bacterium]|nr:monofunctional biosynthetic peptidoglycan transglycosylase [Balneolaceae bacterium]